MNHSWALCWWEACRVGHWCHPTLKERDTDCGLLIVVDRLPRVRLGHHQTLLGADPEREDSGKHWALLRWIALQSYSLLAVFSLLHSFLIFIIGPSSLFLLFHYLKKILVISNLVICTSLLLFHCLLPSTSQFCFKFYFLLLQLVSSLHFYYVSYLQPLKTIFMSLGISHSFSCP